MSTQQELHTLVRDVLGETYLALRIWNYHLSEDVESHQAQIIASLQKSDEIDITRVEGQGVGMRRAGEVREAYLSALDMFVAGIGDGPFLGGSERPGRGDCALAGHLSQLTFKRDLPQVQSVLATHVEPLTI